MLEPLAIRAPDHLGDATMAVPAMRALAVAAPGSTVYGPGFLAGLFAALSFPAVTLRPSTDLPASGTGVLFKPSFPAAWRWRHLHRRVGLAGSARASLLTDPLPVAPGEHRRDGYARIAAHLGAPVQPTPRAPPASPRFVALNPWSPTATVRWPGFRALADLLQDEVPVAFFAGPGEERAVRALAGPHPVHAGLPLPAFAAALDGCALFVSNDSGAAHFADALGVPVLVVHGSTDPALTGVGAAVTGGPIWCGPCYRKTCVLGLSCLHRITPADVAAAVRVHLGALAGAR